MSQQEKYKDLIYNPDYFTEDQKIIERECNGCGPAGWLELLISDTICGVNITHICKLHDYDYYVGYTREHKITADINFLYNILIYLKKNIDLSNRKKWKKATKIAIAYYKAVDTFGDFAFNFKKKKSFCRKEVRQNIKEYLKEKQKNLEWDDEDQDINLNNIKIKEFEIEEDQYL